FFTLGRWIKYDAGSHRRLGTRDCHRSSTFLCTRTTLSTSRLLTRAALHTPPPKDHQSLRPNRQADLGSGAPAKVSRCQKVEMPPPHPRSATSSFLKKNPAR